MTPAVVPEQFFAHILFFMEARRYLSGTQVLSCLAGVVPFGSRHVGFRKLSPAAFTSGYGRSANWGYRCTTDVCDSVVDPSTLESMQQ